MFKRPRAPKWIDGSLRCSFCGKAKSEVAKLIAGPGVYICNECVGLCSEIIEKEQDSEAIQPGEAVSFTLLQEQLHSVLDTLSEREAGVVSMRFGLTDGQPRPLMRSARSTASPGSGSGRSSPRSCRSCARPTVVSP